MTTINDEKSFREAIWAMKYPQQRAVAALFAESVLGLSKDDRLPRLVTVAKDPNTTKDELNAAFKTAKQASVEGSTRCGADGDWTDQASYFVARAVTAAVTPESQSRGAGPALQAAMNSRMATTCRSIEEGEGVMESETNYQYKILDEFLKA